MTLLRILRNSIASVLLTACLGTSAFAQFSDPHAILEQFRENLSNDSEMEVAEIDGLLEPLESAAKEGSLEGDHISEALSQAYPKFAEAVLSAIDDPVNGLAPLEELAASPNRILAAESLYYLGRFPFNQQDFEKALPRFKSLRTDYADATLREGEALYYMGMCQANLLQKTEALGSLVQFVEDYPGASPRLRLSANATLDGIANVMDGSIDDIADHMDFSHRKLSLTDTGERTRDVQQKIIDMLDTLIEKAEEQEQAAAAQAQGQGQGQAQGQMQGQANGMGGAGQGNIQGGNASAQKAPKVVRRVRGAADSAWDDLRDRDRGTEALSSIQSKYPPRYQQLVEQYFSDLQSDEDEDE